MSDWIETYRGAVHRWEQDTVDHFTVAFYFDRLSDATAIAREALELPGGNLVGRQHPSGNPVRAATAGCHVRFLRELRAGDALHILSGVIAVDSGSVLLGHKVLDSADGQLCATVEERVRLVAGRDAVPLAPPLQHALAARRVAWDGPAREVRTAPATDAGFRVCGRDVVMPWEIDLTGQCAMSHFILRFSSAMAQLLSQFGMTPAYMRDQRIGFSTFEFQLEFLDELHAGDPVVVQSALVHLGASSLRMLHRMSNARTGALVATLAQAGVHLDMAARRSAPLPAALRERARSMLVA